MGVNDTCFGNAEINQYECRNGKNGSCYIPQPSRLQFFSFVNYTMPDELFSKSKKHITGHADILLQTGNFRKIAVCKKKTLLFGQ